VIHDEIFKPKFGADAANQLERLTHEMCYLFGRATRVVGICPPAYYADIVCTRARVHVGDILDRAELATVSSGQSGGGGSSRELQLARERRVHPNIADDMYYI